MLPGGMQSAAAMDLGLSALAKQKASTDPMSEDEKLKRKKLMEAQQQKPMSPFGGALLSLTGNQY